MITKLSSQQPEFEAKLSALLRYEGILNKHGFPVGKYGQKFSVQLPEQYAEDSGKPVDAEVVPMPFTASENLNIREKIDS